MGEGDAGGMAELKRIFHVDDEPDIREIVRISLEMVGNFEVEQFASGMEILDHGWSALPDMIILDVMMPGLDGEQTFAKLREIDGLAEIPIVFMTARASDTDYQRLRALGAADVLVKPFDPMALPDQVREIWTRTQ